MKERGGRTSVEAVNLAILALVLGIGCDTNNATPGGWPGAWFFENEPFLRISAALVVVSVFYGLWVGARGAGVGGALYGFTLVPVVTLFVNVLITLVGLAMLMLTTFAVDGTAMVLNFSFSSFCVSALIITAMLGHFSTDLTRAFRQKVLESGMKRAGRLASSVFGVLLGGLGLLLTLRDVYYIITYGW